MFNLDYSVSFKFYQNRLMFKPSKSSFFFGVNLDPRLDHGQWRSQDLAQGEGKPLSVIFGKKYKNYNKNYNKKILKII